MKFFLIVAALACGMLPVLAAAGEGTVIALSAAEVEAAKEAGAKAHAESAALEGISSPKRQVHGEVGFGIGTGGYRSVYGTVVAPLGDTGVVAISMADAQIDHPTRRH
jgi:hypothetical protein